MSRLLKEPLLHFLLLGAVIFIAYHFTSAGTDAGPGKIVITQAQIDSLSIGFSRTWHRLPSKAELDGLIQDQVREEVYYREAVAMGLDRDDTIIRRRLRQKLEFVTNDIAAFVEPSDAQLTAYLEANPERFRLERQFSFSHVFLSPERHGENLARDAAQLLRELKQLGPNADAASFGDVFLLERQFATEPANSIASQFGDEFALAVASLPVGEWSGPVQSGYGIHLVLVQQRTEGRLPEFAQVRDTVKREWSDAQRRESNEKIYQSLLARYQVAIEKPQAGAAAELIASAK